ncbi:MAG: hypothetical protein LBK06_03305 [Planctomycetaceae bacterium]|jgi:hypothetical protein|nr:hypothetical protein [Planctomycetaceae bacterium]
MAENNFQSEVYSNSSNGSNTVAPIWVTMLSPTAKTNPGQWTAFVCRVSFTTTQNNVQVRLRGSCIVLKNPVIKQTSCLLITDTDVNGITVSGSNIVFGSGQTVERGNADVDFNVNIPTAGSHFIDFLFLDADQNTAPFPEGPVTQVWGKIECDSDKLTATGFSLNYTHGYDTSGNNPQTNWTTYTQCYHPENYRKTSGLPVGATLVFNYAWDSPTGQLSDLAGCLVGEKVDYPGSSPAYSFPSPPFSVTVDNPTIKNLPATSGSSVDNHGTAGFKTPYVQSTVVATQNYRYHCEKCMAPSEWTNLMGPLSITRSIKTVSTGGWEYEITKDGVTATLSLTSVSSEEYNNDNIAARMAECVSVIKQIPINATRKDILKYFTISGGISGRNVTRYCFNECRHVNIDVTFDVKDQNGWDEESIDVVVKINKPFIVHYPTID